jgi:anaerobic carbon-monoxide dehydrogenase iron sulfur subunit
MKTLRPNPELCTGCHLCLLGCSFQHEDVFSEALARLKVRADEARWRFEPVVCRQCGDAPCLASCPVAAITRDPATGAVLLDDAACIGCKACVLACPFDVISFNERTGLVQLCDLCTGAPACASTCPHGAITYSE